MKKFKHTNFYKLEYKEEKKTLLKYKQRFKIILQIRVKKK